MEKPLDEVRDSLATPSASFIHEYRSSALCKFVVSLGNCFAACAIASPMTVNLRSTAAFSSESATYALLQIVARRIEIVSQGRAEEGERLDRMAAAKLRERFAFLLNKEQHCLQA